MAGRNTVLEERLKNKLKVLNQQELPFKQVAFDILELHLKDNIVVNYKSFDETVKALKDKYQSELNSIQREIQQQQNSIQQNLF